MRIKRHYFDVALAGGIMGGAVNQILILKSRPHKSGKVLVKKLGVLDAALLGLAPFTGGASAGILTALRGGQALRSAKKLGGLRTAQTGAKAGLVEAEGSLAAAKKVPKLGKVDPRNVALTDLQEQAYGFSDAIAESKGMSNQAQTIYQNALTNPQSITPSRLHNITAAEMSSANAIEDAQRLANINTANTQLTGAQANVSNLGNKVGVLEAQVPAQQKAARDAGIVTGTTGMGHGGANAAAQAEEARRLQERAAGAATGTTGTHMGSMNSSTG